MDTKFFDGLTEGDSPNGVKLGMGLTGGDFWTRLAGCSALYRGLGMNLIDFTNLLAVAEMDSSEISPSYYMPHENNSTYFYVLRRINSCGDEEHTLSAAVKVSIDASGELALSRPNNIFEVRALQVDGNKVQIVWYYYPIKQQSSPTLFNVYYDSGTGQIDYENPIAVISYAGQMFYSYKSEMLETGKFWFAIRAENAAGNENISLAPTQVELYTQSPDEIDIIDAKAV